MTTQLKQLVQKVVADMAREIDNYDEAIPIRQIEDWRDELESALESTQGTASVEEVGPWKAGESPSRIAVSSAHYIDSDDFTYDARLYVTGDFGDPETKQAYTEEIARRLNAQPSPQREEDHSIPLHTKHKDGQEDAVLVPRETLRNWLLLASCGPGGLRRQIEPYVESKT